MSFWVRITYLDDQLDDEPLWTNLTSGLHLAVVLHEAFRDFSEWFHYNWPDVPCPPDGQVAFLGVFVGHGVIPGVMGKATKEPIRRVRSGQRKGGNANGRK